MSKIVLDNVASGYNLAKINNNFQKIEDELNNRVAYRDVEPSESNSLETDIDANDKTLYNLRNPSARGEAVNLGFLEDLSGGPFAVSDWRVETYISDGVRVNYSLEFAPVSVEAVFVTINGVSLVPIDDYLLSTENTLTFITAPANLTKISIRYGTFIGSGVINNRTSISSATASLGSVSLVKDPVNGIIKNVKPGTDILIEDDGNTLTINSNVEVSDLITTNNVWLGRQTWNQEMDEGPAYKFNSGPEPANIPYPYTLKIGMQHDGVNDNKTALLCEVNEVGGGGSVAAITGYATSSASNTETIAGHFITVKPGTASNGVGVKIETTESEHSTVGGTLTGIHNKITITDAASGGQYGDYNYFSTSPPTVATPTLTAGSVYTTADSGTSRAKLRSGLAFQIGVTKALISTESLSGTPPTTEAVFDSTANDNLNYFIKLNKTNLAWDNNALGTNTGKIRIVAGGDNFYIPAYKYGVDPAGAVTYSTSPPLANSGVGSAGVAATVARSDHVHPAGSSGSGDILSTSFYSDPSWITSLSPTKLTTAVPMSKGGTGLTSMGTAGQVLRMNAGATGLEFGTLTGTGADILPLANSWTGENTFTKGVGVTGRLLSSTAGVRVNLTDSSLTSSEFNGVIAVIASSTNAYQVGGNFHATSTSSTVSQTSWGCVTESWLLSPNPVPTSGITFKVAGAEFMAGNTMPVNSDTAANFIWQAGVWLPIKDGPDVGYLGHINNSNQNSSAVYITGVTGRSAWQRGVFFPKNALMKTDYAFRDYWDGTRSTGEALAVGIDMTALSECSFAGGMLGNIRSGVALPTYLPLTLSTDYITAQIKFSDDGYIAGWNNGSMKWGFNQTTGRLIQNGYTNYLDLASSDSSPLMSFTTGSRWFPVGAGALPTLGTYIGKMRVLLDNSTYGYIPIYSAS